MQQVADRPFSIRQVPRNELMDGVRATINGRWYEIVGTDVGYEHLRARQLDPSDSPFGLPSQAAEPVLFGEMVTVLHNTISA